MEAQELADSLIRWYEPDARRLPWRAHGDPYEVLVAEFMLQQTQVATALPRYRRFLERWPTLEALADASEDDVLAAWSGLGYYRRARNLHATARRIMTEHGGRVPSEPAVLEGLPGIGQYTAGAIASTAYRQAVPALDGNVLRVVGRFLGLPGRSTTAAYRRGVRHLVQALLGHADPGAVNQALMDLGSRVCRPRKPECPACPWEQACAARATGHPERIPARVRAAKPVERLVALIAWRGDRLLVEPVTGHGVLEGLWAPPLRLRAPAGARALAPIHHTFSHKRWEVVAHVVRRPGGRTRRGRWVTPEELAELPTSSLARKLVDQALEHRT